MIMHGIWSFFIGSNKKAGEKLVLAIEQILNNNALLVDMGDEKSAIVTGKGIGFQKKAGDLITTDKVEAVYYLGSSIGRENLYYLLKNIPIDIVIATYSIVEMAQQDFHFPAIDYIYITLSDHFWMMYKRLLDGAYKGNAIPDMRDQYPIEYEIARRGRLMINDALNIIFPESEENSIALHFINAKDEALHNEHEFTYKGVSFAKSVSSILEKNGIIRTINNRHFFDRLMIHLQYLVERIAENKLDDTSSLEDFTVDLKNKHPRAYKVVKDIEDELIKVYGIELNDNERLYFVIHVERLIQEL